MNTRHVTSRVKPHLVGYARVYVTMFMCALILWAVAFGKKDALDAQHLLKDDLKPMSKDCTYVLKDTRPLSVKTTLHANDTLWEYPQNEDAPFRDGPWYSQTHQDEMLYRGFFRNTYGGVFVELGAADGITFSNTKFFQDSMNWTGLLIEPSEDYEYLFRGLYAYPKKRRGMEYSGPKRCTSGAKCVREAVCKGVGTVNMTKVPNGSLGNMVGGATDYMTDGHRKRFKIPGEDKVYEVPCKPFGQILREAGITRIDLLSLDVEGAEEVVLETMDWDIPIHVIVIEADEGNSPTGPEGHERKHRILLENGFKYLQFYKFDEWWVKPENRRP